MGDLDDGEKEKRRKKESACRVANISMCDLRRFAFTPPPRRSSDFDDDASMANPSSEMLVWPCASSLEGAVQRRRDPKNRRCAVTVFDSDHLRKGACTLSMGQAEEEDPLASTHEALLSLHASSFQKNLTRRGYAPCVKLTFETFR